MELNSRSIYGCTEAPERFAAPANTILTYNPTSNRLYIHLLAYPGTRLACPFADEIAYAQFLHDASEIRFTEGRMEHFGEGLPDREDMVVFYAVAGSFALLLAEKLLLLEGKNLENGGDTTII